MRRVVQVGPRIHMRRLWYVVCAFVVLYGGFQEWFRRGAAQMEHMSKNGWGEINSEDMHRLRHNGKIYRVTDFNTKRLPSLPGNGGNEWQSGINADPHH